MDFESRVKPYLNELQLYCRRLTASRWDAEDLCQEVLLRVYRHDAAHGGIRQMRPFLYTVARRLRIDQRRRRRPECVPLDAAPEPHAADPGYASARSLAEWVTGALPEREARMLLLAAVCGFSYADIAEALDTTVPTVRMGLLRARAVMRAERDDSAPAAKRVRKRQPSWSQEEIDAWAYALMRGEPVPQALPV